jgi:hypothetical protein
MTSSTLEGNLSLVHNYQMNQSEQAVSLTVPLTVYLVAAPTLFRTLLCQELFPISSWPKMVELWMLRRMPGKFQRRREDSVGYFNTGFALQLFELSSSVTTGNFLVG